MRKVIAAALICIVPSIVSACIPERHTPAIRKQPMYKPFGLSVISGEIIPHPRTQLSFRTIMMTAPMMMQVSAYSGIAFHHGAYFCRMENYFLNNYNVKFSIHTGGFRE